MGRQQRNPMPRILVVNPNSNETVTRGLADALKPLAFEGGPEIVCKTLAEGPYGIESQADVESVVLPLRRLVEADNESDAFVIACMSAATAPAARCSASPSAESSRRSPAATASASSPPSRNRSGGTCAICARWA